MNKGRTSKKSNTNILMLLIVALIVFSGYRFGFMNFNNKTSKLKEQNESHEAEIKALEVKMRNKDMYLEEIERAKTDIDAILALYGPGVTPEKSTMFILGLENSVGQMSIPNLSFGDSQVLLSNDNIPGSEGTPVIGMNSLLSFSYKTTYQGLKDCIKYISEYPERMNIQSVTASYDAETGNLSGSILLKQYSVYTIKNPYQPPEIGGIRLGKDNIFDTSEIWQK